ncbi:DUF5081 family protein [Anaerosacchariphilus polymeriproducens]|uniref:DUF5081 family protein n=1 Tax=Anaerosacchariphilus polymeriproducens TaxID=1812858 RepID=A0A371AXN0_9FIRM|nr:DUF5081 family protein [Anaerosacchariphilus polymeriproducens]RDU24240.1 DUF5081 family protein [Anaerosacchariphilus polymeriproducens]
MTLNEIMVLNRGIDNSEIMGIPEGVPFDIKKDKELILEGKSNLIQKGILANHDTFTIKGALIFSRLIEYKKAKKYLCIQGMWIGLVDEKKSVIIQKKDIDSYYFESIATDSIVNYLIEKYPFLQENKELGEPIEKQISGRDIFQMYYIESETGFLFDIIDNSDTSQSKKRNGILFFNHREKDYRYDINLGVLQQVTGEMIQSEIQNKMRLENSYEQRK